MFETFFVTLKTLDRYVLLMRKWGLDCKSAILFSLDLGFNLWYKVVHMDGYMWSIKDE